MPSVSGSTADPTAATGEEPSSSFERKNPSGNASSKAGATQNEASTTNTLQDDMAMAEEDKDNPNEAIIAILEDWAAWERGLEKEAGKSEVARDIKKIADEPGPFVDSDTVQRDPKSSQCTVTEFDDNAPVQITPIPRKDVRSTTNALRATTGQLYPTRRDRRRAERNDPIARTRREALKVWAADQTRRRSSAGDLGLDHGQIKTGLSLKDWVARRRSSAESTVDQARKESESWQEQRTGRTAGPLPVSPPPDSRHRPSQHVKKSSTATDKTISRWRGPHPGRGGRARHEKPERLAPDDIEAWEGEARTAPPTPRAPGSIVTGRASPWARSPSRETAGGILVKHCFFYGPAGKIALGRSPNTTPSFESQWMRKFREEVQGNPNWWAGPGEHHSGGSPDRSRRSSFLRTGSGMRPAYPSRTGASAVGEKGGASRNTNLWDEVRSLLARSRRSDGTNVAGGGSDGGANAGAATPERVDALSFGDRLRCTPLSQGAWLIDSAVRERSSREGSWRDDDGAALTLAKQPRGGTTKAPGVQASSEKVLAARAVADHSPMSSKAPALGKVGFRAREFGGCTSGDDVGNSAQRKSLQSVHEAILAKLRGEIDPATREEIVLRAAEDAKGALARDQAHTTSLRRASVGVHRLSSGGKEGPVPAPIDYDKVEATLSLIELASRAAGPDAGKQMLQALEGLDKIHQRVSDDEVGGEKRNASKDKANLIAGSVRVDGDGKELTLAEANGNKPCDGLAPIPTLPDDKAELPAEVMGKEKGPHQRSRRISLAVSDVSDIGTGPTPTGVIQSIGNWLRRTDRPPSRQHSFESAIAEMDGDRHQQVPGREGFSSALSVDPEEHGRGDVDARNSEETGSKEEGREEEAHTAQRASVTAQQSREVDGRTSNGTSRVGAHASDGAQHFADKTSVGEARDDRGIGAAVDAVPTPTRNISTSVPDDRTLERPMETQHASQADKAVSPESPSPPSKAVDIEKTESLRRPTAVRKTEEMPQCRVVSPERRWEPTKISDKEKKLQPATGNTTDMRVKVGGTQRVGFSLDDSIRRDSWISLGTRPKRGGDRQEIKSVREGARAVAPVKLFGDGRLRAKTTAATEACAIQADLREPLSSGAPTKVRAKFVWPRPGRSISGKRVKLPEAATSKTSSGKAPGIVRRSPLIDALHPAVAKQRAFRLTLRKTGEQGVPTPMAAGKNKAVSASRKKRGRKREDVAQAGPPAMNSIAGKISTRRGERRPLSGAPPSSSPSPAGQHPRSAQLPTGLKPPLGEESGSSDETMLADTAAPAIRLTVGQRGRVEDWMGRAKHSLGPKVWDCLGSSPAFYRVRGRFRSFLDQADTCRVVDGSGQPLGYASPLRGGESGGQFMEASEARDKRVVFGPTSRNGKGHEMETDNKGEDTSGWGDRLSQKAALVVEAIMWTLATERERSIARAAILRDRKVRSEHPSISPLEVGNGIGDTLDGGEGNAESPPTDTTLAVSWLRVRRFAKSSRLVDGVDVVDADVDLAFKRWEESERAERPALVTTTNRTCSPRRPGPETPAPGLWTGVKAANVRARDAATIPRMCDAVGCSEGGRYGGICPTETTRFCRKHRRDGMMDLGGRRCERADCGRLAARGSTLGSTRKSTLCSLHTQEGRVDVEGLAFVFLALGEARRRGVRKLAAKTGGASRNILPSTSEAAADTAVLDASTVRDLVLALTNQPFTSALPNAAHASSQSPPRIETCDASGSMKAAVQPDYVSQPTLLVAARSVEGAAAVAPATVGLHSPNDSGCLSGDNRTSDEAKASKALPNLGHIGVAEHGFSAAGESSSKPLDRGPSAMNSSGSQSFPHVEDEATCGGSGAANPEESIQPHEAEAHGEGQPEAEKNGCGSGEGKGDECLVRKSRGNRIRSYLPDGGDDESRKLGAQSLNASRTGHGDCAHRSNSTGAAWNGIRWRGVDEVLGENTRALRAVFRRYSRPSGGAREREMALPDVLGFCDAFELRPGLVSTREIVDGFKEVIYPGVMGLTDEEIGYSVKTLERSPSRRPTRSGQSQQAAFPPTRIRRVSRQNGALVEGETVAPADTRAGEGGADFCANFSSYSGGGDHARVSSRHTSTNSGAGGRAKTVYLGRAQKFPLRRVKSTIASCDQDLGGSTDSSAGSLQLKTGDGVRRRASFRISSIGRMGNPHLDANARCGVMAGVCEARDPPVAPGLSLPQFLEWMSEMAVKCPTPVKAFGRAFARLPNEQRFDRGENGRPGPLLASTGKASRVSSTSRENAAKAVVMLQWMELSRGMRNGGIPPFSLSSCLAETAPACVGFSGRR